MTGRILLFLLIMFLAACSAVPTQQDRRDSIDALALQHDWHGQVIHTAYFEIQSYLPDQFHPAKQLTIYIEGDGLAWLTRTTVSSNPTPINPLAFKLALKNNTPAVAYLARPCQFVWTSICEQSLWTSARFSPKIIASMNDAVSQLKAEYDASSIRLIGYSGGGAVATLLAARRDDVTQLITVAGNIDTQFWTKFQHISPLTGSLNPADYWQQLETIPQIHFVGSEDTIMPKAIAESYQSHFPKNARPEIRVITGMTHHCCWVQRWPELLQQIPDILSAK